MVSRDHSGRDDQKLEQSQFTGFKFFYQLRRLNNREMIRPFDLWLKGGDRVVKKNIPSAGSSKSIRLTRAMLHQK